jgi:hypothetical protein
VVILKCSAHPWNVPADASDLAILLELDLPQLCSSSGIQGTSGVALKDSTLYGITLVKCSTCEAPWWYSLIALLMQP